MIEEEWDPIPRKDINYAKVNSLKHMHPFTSHKRTQSNPILSAFKDKTLLILINESDSLMVVLNMINLLSVSLPLFVI